MNRPELTYPCVVGPYIMELTAEQRDALAWRTLSPHEQIAILLQRIEALESTQKTMAQQIAQQASRLQTAETAFRIEP